MEPFPETLREKRAVKNSSIWPLGSCHPTNGKNLSLSKTDSSTRLALCLDEPVEPEPESGRDEEPEPRPSAMGTVRTSSAQGSVEVNTHGPRTHPPLLSTTSAVDRAGPAPTATAAAAPRRLAPTGAHGPLGDSAILGIDEGAGVVSDQSPAPEPEPGGSSSSSTRTPPDGESTSQRISNGVGAATTSPASRDATAIHPAPAHTPVL